MGLAPVAHVLFNKFMRYKVSPSPCQVLITNNWNSFNPQNPDWVNRDRFVLSNGHGCMLQYSLLHLFGFKVSMDDLKAFRVRCQTIPYIPGEIADM